MRVRSDVSTAGSPPSILLSAHPVATCPVWEAAAGGGEEEKGRRGQGDKGRRGELLSPPLPTSPRKQRHSTNDVINAPAAGSGVPHSSCGHTHPCTRV